MKNILALLILVIISICSCSKTKPKVGYKEFILGENKQNIIQIISKSGGKYTVGNCTSPDVKMEDTICTDFNNYTIEMQFYKDKILSGIIIKNAQNISDYNSIKKQLIEKYGQPKKEITNTIAGKNYFSTLWEFDNYQISIGGGGIEPNKFGVSYEDMSIRNKLLNEYEEKNKIKSKDF